jgi:hypothetical protein
MELYIPAEALLNKALLKTAIVVIIIAFFKPTSYGPTY